MTLVSTHGVHVSLCAERNVSSAMVMRADENRKDAAGHKIGNRRCLSVQCRLGEKRRKERIYRAYEQLCLE